MPDLNELDAFAAVARHRNFRKAATERGVSASALSHALRGLEERLGVRLLNRTTRSVTPTEAGLQLLARLSPALQEINHALSDLRTLQDVPAGTLRINAPRPAAQLLLAPILATFSANFPRIQVEIITDDTLIDIVGAGFDAGVRFGESLAGDMIAVPFGKPQHFAVVASPDYLAKHGTPTVPQDLSKHRCIERRFPSGSRYAWEFEQAGRAISVMASGPLVFDDDTLMVRTALDGAGLAYVYRSYVSEPIAQGRLVSVLDDWCPPPSRFFLYYPSRRQMPPTLRAFINAIQIDERPSHSRT